MEFLISIRDEIGRMYGKYDTLFRSSMKFFMALATFIMIGLVMGQMPAFENLLIVLVLSVLCAFLPTDSIVLIGALLAVFHFYSISLEAMLAGGGLLVIALLLYFSVAPRTAFPLLFGAIAAGFHIPGAAAVLFGLLAGPLAAVGVGFGVLICYLLRMVSAYGGNLQAASSDAADALMEKIVLMTSKVWGNKEMILTAILCVLIIWIVNIIRRLQIPYAWMIAAAIGSACMVAGRILGMYFLKIPFELLYLAIEVLAGLVFAWFAQILFFNLDYKKTEMVQFEDDEYYYYVKAVPKKRFMSEIETDRKGR